MVLEKRTPKILHQLPKTLVRIEKEINLLVRVGFFMSKNETCRGLVMSLGGFVLQPNNLFSGRPSTSVVKLINIFLTTNIW